MPDTLEPKLEEVDIQTRIKTILTTTVMESSKTMRIVLEIFFLIAVIQFPAITTRHLLGKRKKMIIYYFMKMKRKRK